MVVIPCEGGLAYSLARRISAQRIFEKRYGMSYRFFIESEHINVPARDHGGAAAAVRACAAGATSRSWSR